MDTNPLLNTLNDIDDPKSYPDFYRSPYVKTDTLY